MFSGKSPTVALKRRELAFELADKFECNELHSRWSALNTSNGRCRDVPTAHDGVIVNDDLKAVATLTLLGSTGSDANRWGAVDVDIRLVSRLLLCTENLHLRQVWQLDTRG